MPDKSSILRALLLILLTWSAVTPAAQQLQPYTRTSGVSGSLSAIGSDTLANMMTLWAEEFQRLYPNVSFQIQAAGSSSAPIALTEGTTDFGPMSRAMKLGEIQAFENRHGYKPTRIPVAIDALAVFVHKDNPLRYLTLAQLDAIFSVTRKCGIRQGIRNWQQLGLEGSWSRRSIQLFGRNSVSGTYGYFKQKALCKGDFLKQVNEQPGSASVVQSISSSLNSIGYSAIGYKTSGVKALAIGREKGQYVEATVQNAIAGDYPLSRYLYLYLNKHPQQALKPAEQEFLRLVLSRQGQQIVQQEGYIPLPAAISQQALTSLGLH